MNINKEYLFISITFPKPIIERDDGQNINLCVATHSEKNACGVIGYASSSEYFHRHTLKILQLE